MRNPPAAATAALAPTLAGLSAAAADDDPDGRAMRIFGRVDVDGDGRITAVEAGPARAAWFHRTDANGNGRMEQDEMTRAATPGRTSGRRIGLKGWPRTAMVRSRAEFGRRAASSALMAMAR